MRSNPEHTCLHTGDVINLNQAESLAASLKAQVHAVLRKVEEKVLLEKVLQ